MKSTVSEQSRKIYLQRINHVLDYMDAHLAESLNMNTLADIACFSPFHFNRIFSALIQETPNNYLRRMRIEKAAWMLVYSQELSITEISELCGFRSMPVFCRTFRGLMQLSPGEYRKVHKDYTSKIRQMHSSFHQLDSKVTPYFCGVQSLNIWRTDMKTKIELLNMPEMHVIYCRHIGDFNQIWRAYEKLLKWAGPRGLVQNTTKTITVYHDDPSITQVEKVRQSAGIVVDKNAKPEGEFGKLVVAAQKCVVGHFELLPTDFEIAWNSVCLWLTESGYQPTDGLPYELYHNDHTQHPEGKFIVDICVPVKPLQV
jgi:AraC family transcriptional regulator